MIIRKGMVWKLPFENHPTYVLNMKLKDSLGDPVRMAHGKGLT